ncbi:MAG: hypothetical protein AAFY03_05015 [Pseudomonadota bacterium]
MSSAKLYKIRERWPGTPNAHFEVLIRGSKGVYFIARDPDTLRPYTFAQACLARAFAREMCGVSNEEFDGPHTSFSNGDPDCVHCGEPLDDMSIQFHQLYIWADPDGETIRAQVPSSCPACEKPVLVVWWLGDGLQSGIVVGEKTEADKRFLAQSGRDE